MLIIPATVDPDAGAVIETVGVPWGGVDAFETLSVTEVDAESPAASVARAVSVWVPFVIEVVTHE